MNNFEGDFQDAKRAEAVLDRFFKTQFTIEPLDKRGELILGIDRVFTCRETSRRLTFEYKACWRSEETGNAFIEVVSNDQADTPGWALKSLAQVLVYYLPWKGLGYLVDMTLIKRAVRGWQTTQSSGQSPNPTYASRGLLVPLPEFAQLAFNTVNLPCLERLHSNRLPPLEYIDE